MADVKSIDIGDREISITLRISRDEYEVLRQTTTDILVLPTDHLDQTLTTGKLGNSNRLMLPKKLLGKYNVTELKKKVHARIFRVNEEIFLLVKLKESTTGIPKFGDAYE